MFSESLLCASPLLGPGDTGKKSVACRRRAVILNAMVGLTEMIMFQQRVEEGEGVNCLDIWGKWFLSIRKSQWKGFEVERYTLRTKEQQGDQCQPWRKAFQFTKGWNVAMQASKTVCTPTYTHMHTHLRAEKVSPRDQHSWFLLSYMWGHNSHNLNRGNIRIVKIVGPGVRLSECKSWFYLLFLQPYENNIASLYLSFFFCKTRMKLECEHCCIIMELKPERTNTVSVQGDFNGQ